MTARPAQLPLVSEETGATLLPALPRDLIAGRGRELLEPARLARAREGWAPPSDVRRGADRERLAAALAADNQRFGHPRAEELASRLSHPRCRVIVTGQQPGLFGGPLYTLSKMVAATLWAEKLHTDDAPAVAVFWSATEDHDFREVTTLELLVDGSPKAFGLGEDPEPLRPVGSRTCGPGVGALLQELAALDERSSWQRALDLAGRCYTAEAKLGDAFATFMVALLGTRAPLILDSSLGALKEAQSPYLARLVERRFEVDALCAARDAAIREAGYALQVTPQPDCSPLFLVEGDQRRRIEWLGEDRWSLRGAEQSWPIERLLEHISEEPWRISPGVLCRPVIQDAVLGSDLFLLGPGEMSYLPQVAPLYALLEVQPPGVSLRPQLAVLEPRHFEWMDELEQRGIGLSWLLAEDAALEQRLADHHGDDVVAACTREVMQRIAELEAPLTSLDANLERPLAKTRQNIERSLATLEEKANAAAARRDEVLHRRVQTLRDSLRPGGGLQERRLGCLWFLGRYGEGLVEAIATQLDLADDVLQIVCAEPSG